MWMISHGPAQLAHLSTALSIPLDSSFLSVAVLVAYEMGYLFYFLYYYIALLNIRDTNLFSISSLTTVAAGVEQPETRHFPPGGKTNSNSHLELDPFGPGDAGQRRPKLVM